MKITKLEDKTIIELSEDESKKLKNEIEFIEQGEGLINPMYDRDEKLNEGSPLLREIWESLVIHFINGLELAMPEKHNGD